MQIPVLIERVADNGFRATTGEPLALSVEAATRDAAIAGLRAELADKVKNGAELVPLEMPGEQNPWLAMAGLLDHDDPMIDDWKQSMKEYRDRMESAPLVLSVEAATRDEEVAGRLQNGAELMTVQISAGENSLIKFAGMFKDDPYFDEWQQAIAENRRLAEADPEIP